MSGPVTLTPEQIAQDFLAANPQQHHVTVITSPPDLQQERKEENEMSQVTVYTHETVLKFGKYKGTGLTVEDIATTDPKYLIWAHENIAWFALEEQIYKDVCILANVPHDQTKAKKATQSPEQPSSQQPPNHDLFDNDDPNDDKYPPF